MALGNLDKIKIMCLGDLTRDQPILLYYIKLEISGKVRSISISHSKRQVNSVPQDERL